MEMFGFLLEWQRAIPGVTELSCTVSVAGDEERIL